MVACCRKARFNGTPVGSSLLMLIFYPLEKCMVSFLLRSVLAISWPFPCSFLDIIPKGFGFSWFFFFFEISQGQWGASDMGKIFRCSPHISILGSCLAFMLAYGCEWMCVLVKGRLETQTKFAFWQGFQKQEELSPKRLGHSFIINSGLL